MKNVYAESQRILKQHGINITDYNNDKKEQEKVVMEKVNNTADRELERECRSMKKMRI